MRQRRNRSARTATLVAVGLLFRPPPRSTGVVEFANDRDDVIQRRRTDRHLAQQREHVFAGPNSSVQVHQQRSNDRHVKKCVKTPSLESLISCPKWPVDLN